MPHARLRDDDANTGAIVTYEPQPMPPEALMNPYAACAVTMDMICLGVRSLLALIRRKREVRALERIAVLPPRWDALGRHCENRSTVTRRR